MNICNECIDLYLNISLCENKLLYKYNCLLDVATPGSCIKASPLMQPVAASPKGDLNTGVLLYLIFYNFTVSCKSDTVHLLYFPKKV